MAVCDRCGVRHGQREDPAVIRCGDCRPATGLFAALTRASSVPARPGFYVLDARGAAVPEPNPRRWQVFMNHGERVLVSEDLGGGSVLSTAFVGVHMGDDGGQPPLVWETALLSGLEVLGVRHYATREDARAGHYEIATTLAALASSGRGIRIRDEDPQETTVAESRESGRSKASV